MKMRADRWVLFMRSLKQSLTLGYNSLLPIRHHNIGHSTNYCLRGFTLVGTYYGGFILLVHGWNLQHVSGLLTTCV